MIDHTIIRSICENKTHYKKHNVSRDTSVIGWGTKPNTKSAKKYAQIHNLPFITLEDGFIRSIGLGVQNSLSFSIISDNSGVYYDATRSSDLENILNTHNFQNDKELIDQARKSISLIKRHHISKYNASPDLENDQFQETDKKRILIIAQTAGDMSLQYGLGNNFSTNDIINAAINENPDAEIFIKIHPDVIAGKKKSNFNIKVVSENCNIISDEVNPISLLKKFYKIYTKTSQMGFEALLLNKEVVCFGMPFYAGWGLTDDRVQCKRRIRKLTVEEIFAGAYILYTNYYNPYTNQKSDIVDTINTIKKYRNIELTNNANLYFFGFSLWKHWLHKCFFKSYGKNSINFCSNPAKAIKKGFRDKSKIFIWGKEDFLDIEIYAKEKKIPVYRVEDGFIRSVSLGSDLTMPYSLVVDSRGIYFDPTKESDLEVIYNTYDFDSHENILERAEIVSRKITQSKISKYNNLPHKKLSIDRSAYDKIILIPGQVEDDASIRFGGYGMTNSSLLKQVRNENPDSYLIYKPHPDVLAGNRKGNIDKEFMHQHCDQVARNQSIDSCLDVSDEVHTITSLCGFDGLLRGKKVVTYGMPFYAGWGLTEDKLKCKRRTRKLSLYELVAGALIIYPRYVNPRTKEFCEIEIVLEEIEKEKEKYFSSIYYRIKRDLRNFLLRKVRRLYEIITFS
ncbi:MAG: capsular polysaccharide biosynthesis protein [Desulfobacterales bacterium]|nr:capsular polysaccharide biosynthesis protein [Desulfobacterales bacterium]